MADNGKLIRKKAAMNEFMDVVSTFILPLVDVRGNVKLIEKERTNSELVVFGHNKNGQNIIRIYPCISTSNNPSPFYCEVGTYSTPAMKTRLEVILREILKVTEYNCFNNRIKKQRNYGTKNSKHEAYKGRTLALAFELGMCSWLAPDYDKAITLYSILCRMMDWAGRTYEGKNVPFGIIIDFDSQAPIDAVSYLHFLENDSSAVFTDGIFSGILLDKEGKLLSFLTRNSMPPTISKEQDIFVPYQFADMAQHCTKNAIGIIVPANGEILIIKNNAVCFAKRGSKWVSFDWERVYKNLRPYFLLGKDKDEGNIRNRIKAIYTTLLDVSFSHTGGCLAVVVPNVGTEEISRIIKDRFDLSVAGNLPEGISMESKEKIEVLKYLLADTNNSIRSFFEIEKPLRKEILSLDGATVVSLDGSFYCAGSIVAVPGGSSGGGRTAAAKRLAQIGVGIKISEDGYIEAYGAPINGTCGKKTVSRTIPLFKIK